MCGCVLYVSRVDVCLRDTICVAPNVLAGGACNSSVLTLAEPVKLEQIVALDSDCLSLSQ